jgi:hypothetical protein
LCYLCLYSALNDSYTGDNIKGMLNLKFEVTNTIIWLIVLIGGFALLVIQHFLTKTIATYIYNKKNLH